MQPSTSGLSIAAEGPESVPLVWPFPETMVTATDMRLAQTVSSDGISRSTGFITEIQPLIWPLPQINLEEMTVFPNLSQNIAITDNRSNLGFDLGGNSDAPYLLGRDVSPVTSLTKLP